MQVILLPKVGYCFYDFSKIDNFMFVYYCSCVSDLGSFFVYRTNNAMLSWHQVKILFLQIKTQITMYFNTFINNIHLLSF